jgi:transposase
MYLSRVSSGGAGQGRHRHRASAVHLWGIGVYRRVGGQRPRHRRRGARPVPRRTDQQGPSGLRRARHPAHHPRTLRPDRPPPGSTSRLDPETYRQRNVVERRLNRLKQWSGSATRYAKPPVRRRKLPAKLPVKFLASWGSIVDHLGGAPSEGSLPTDLTHSGDLPKVGWDLGRRQTSSLRRVTCG